MCPKVLRKAYETFLVILWCYAQHKIGHNCFNHGEWHKDIVHGLNLPESTIHSIYMQGERILRATQDIIASASSKVVFFSEHLVMDKMESLLLEWIDGYTKCDMYLPYYSCFFICLCCFRFYDVLHFGGVCEHSKIFSYKLMIITSSLYIISAYESFSRNALLSDSR